MRRTETGPEAVTAGHQRLLSSTVASLHYLPKFGPRIHVGFMKALGLMMKINCTPTPGLSSFEDAFSDTSAYEYI